MAPPVTIQFPVTISSFVQYRQVQAAAAETTLVLVGKPI